MSNYLPFTLTDNNFATLPIAFFPKRLLADRSYTTTMTEEWKNKQFQQLAIFREVRQRQVDPSAKFEEFPQPAPSHLALLQIYTDILDGKDSARTAAKQINNWVLSVPDNDTCYDIAVAYGDVLLVLLTAARELSSRKHLQILADLTVELASLPDVYNDTDKPIVFEEGSVVVQPGQRIKLPCQTGGELWSGLPDFALCIRDDLHDGPLHFRAVSGTGDGNQQQPSCEAEDMYTNVNTFAALIARQDPPQASPLHSCVDFAFATFAFLEHGPGTNYDQESHLTVRAAAAWLIIAGEQLVAAGSPSTKYNYTSGSLWEAEGGTNTVDVKRLRFWKDWFQNIRDSGRLSGQKAVEATIEATAVLERLIAAQDGESLKAPR